MRCPGSSSSFCCTSSGCSIALPWSCSTLPCSHNKAGASPILSTTIYAILPHVPPARSLISSSCWPAICTSAATVSIGYAPTWTCSRSIYTRLHKRTRIIAMLLDCCVLCYNSCMWTCHVEYACYPMNYPYPFQQRPPSPPRRRSLFASLHTRT